MNVGFWLSDDNFDAQGAGCTAAGALDVGGVSTALACNYVLLRVYYKGNPDPQAIAAKIIALDQKAAAMPHHPTVYYQVGNEPNLPQEQWQGGLDAYTTFYKQVRSLVPTRIHLAWAGVSPNMVDWPIWYDAAARTIAPGDAIVAHLYAQLLSQLIGLLQRIMDLVPTSTPVIIGECNFGPGAGIKVDLDAWAGNVWAPFLEYVRTQLARILFTLYFPYTWNSDMQLDTHPDAAGTRIVPTTIQMANVPLPEPAPPTYTPRMPEGRAWWIWYVSACGGADGIIAACKRTNTRVVYIKGGDGPVTWEQITPELVDALTAAGIAVYVWHYTYLGWIAGTVHGVAWRWTVGDEVACVRQMIERAGPNVAGFVSDAEAETEGRPAEAIVFCAGVQALLRGRFFGYAPLPVIDYHTLLPYVQYNRAVHAVMPQLYSKNIGGTPAWTLARLLEQWDRWGAAWLAEGNVSPPLMPVGEAYGVVVPEDILAFEQLRSDRKWASWSYWSLQHALEGNLISTVAAIAANDYQEDTMITPTPTDRVELEAIFADMWTKVERAGEIIGNAQYGAVGARTAYWSVQGVKAAIDLAKELLGMNV